MIRILLIEDNPDDGDLFAVWLDGDPGAFAVERAGTLGAGIEHLGAGDCDLVLLDLTLPDAAGLATFTRLAAAAPGVPVVVLSGNADEALAVQAVQAGAQDYILKDDINQRTLSRAIRYAMERHRAARTLEEQRSQLIYASKMSALGEMSAAICHEINNPLAVIRGQAQSLQKALRRAPLDLDVADDMLERIVRMTARAAEITNALRAFARKGGSDPLVQARVSDLVRDAIALCGERFRAAGVQLDSPAVACDLVVDCRPSELAQLLLNLLNNAFDAVVTPSARARRVAIEAEDLGRSVALRVVDDGCGLAHGVREQLMQPFFTTKPRGHGLGLGLYISQRIAEKHGGSLTCESGRGQTAFVLTIPKGGAPLQDAPGGHPDAGRFSSP